MNGPLVLVLAAGVSRRFWPLHDKLLLPFGSQSLLERHLKILAELGCERVILISRPDEVERLSAITADFPGEATIAVQAEPRGMADAILSAGSELERHGDGPVYVTQAHDVAEKRLHAEMLERWDSSREQVSALIAGARVQSYFPGGYLTLEGQRVRSVVEKPGAGKEPSDLVNLVAHIFASWRDLTEALSAEAEKPGKDDVYERALAAMMLTHDIRAHVYEGRWQGLKYPWQALDIMDLLLDLWTSGAEGPGEGYEQREDGVFVAQDVRIFPGAHVVAPALVGPRAVIGHNALVRGSIIGGGSVVGFGSEVARTLLAGDVALHHNYAGDSVLDRGSSMGFGAATANYRIDGRTVASVVNGERLDTGRMKLGLMLGAATKVGVNTSTMPGVKIGAGCMIGPGLNVTKDVPDGERVLDSEKYGRF
jgi:UDP-N-acetylglucosamine diphosphorylase / glucose-1-phosphate thymidylyltransferase / UDP-N-acetylgalactosamine diphosphorylase / glucosamine-1-phosphate N-acetyltransferase / galactosamine-1-phosphate N-acetyltransferase